ncbi:MAG: hypothetical protein C0614_06720 [Desulfuromonas sp.]|nr:MAG: hypothetical protein C0614_06720 [Desulfuromonas sp.]
MNQKLRILIIEDEESIRDSLQWFLEDLGHEVVSTEVPHQCDVYNGQPCTRQKSCTDALIIDQHLPGMLGLDFVEQLTERGCKGIISNMLLVSGDATSVDMQKANALGLSVVQKPMTFDFLEDWLRKVDPV